MSRSNKKCCLKGATRIGGDLEIESFLFFLIWFKKCSCSHNKNVQIHTSIYNTYTMQYPPLGLNEILQLPYFSEKLWGICCFNKAFFFKHQLKMQIKNAYSTVIAELSCFAICHFWEQLCLASGEVIKTLVLASENCVPRWSLEVPEGVFYYSVKCAFTLAYCSTTILFSNVGDC